MAVKFHLVRFGLLCQLSKNILHIDSGFHTLFPIAFNKTEPGGIPYAHSLMRDLTYCPVFQVTSSCCLKGTLSYFFLTSWFTKLHWLGCYCMQDGTLNHPGINMEDSFYCTEVGRGPAWHNWGGGLRLCSAVCRAVLGQLPLWLEVGSQQQWG